MKHFKYFFFLLIFSLVLCFGALLIAAANEEGMITNQWLIPFLTKIVTMVNSPGFYLRDDLSISMFDTSFGKIYLFGIICWDIIFYSSFVALVFLLSKMELLKGGTVIK
jgi:hypothetical protein